LQAGVTPDKDLSLLFYPPAVSLTALSLATVLAVVKPWGRIRSTRQTGNGIRRGGAGLEEPGGE
jgi:predicted lysophospholipase L1 biosynthesis ABC-type transport system permease subunit